MADIDYNGDDDAVIDRTTTVIRFLYTFVFMIIVRLIEIVLAFVVLFELVYSLVTRLPPNPWVTRFAHRILRYAFAVGQYVTYNTDRLPFPFEELPNGTEPINLSPAAPP